MHDQIGVGVRHRRQDVEKHANTIAHTQPLAVAVRIDRLAGDVFQHEIRLADRRHAGIDDPGDLGVRQAAEDASFAREPRFAGAADERGVQQLDGDPAVVAPVGALGQPHAAHAAVADRLDQPVRAQLQSGQGRPRRLDGGSAGQEVVVLDGVALGEPAGNLAGELG